MTTFQEINNLTDNCANTLVFTQEDADKILFPEKNMDFNLSHDEHRVQLERLYHNEMQLKMHGSTLSEYWRNKRIPRGLRIPKPPTLCKQNKQFLKKWSEILNKCSMDLMLLIVEQVSADVHETHEKIVLLEEKIKSTSHIDFDSLSSSIKLSTEKYRDYLKDIKLKKYKRDTEDYLRNEVYPWDSRPATMPNMRDSGTREANALVRGSSGARFRNRIRRNGSTFFNGQSDSTESEFTIDSDSSAHASSFLDRRAPPRRLQRRNVEEVQEPQRSLRPWTRSYSKRR